MCLYNIFLTVLGLVRHWCRALLLLRRPVHALAVGKGGEVGVPVYASVEVEAPHALGVGAVPAVRPLAAGGAARGTETFKRTKLKYCLATVAHYTDLRYFFATHGVLLGRGRNYEYAGGITNEKRRIFFGWTCSLGPCYSLEQMSFLPDWAEAHCPAISSAPAWRAPGRRGTSRRRGRR